MDVVMAILRNMRHDGGRWGILALDPESIIEGNSFPISTSADIDVGRQQTRGKYVQERRVPPRLSKAG